MRQSLLAIATLSLCVTVGCVSPTHAPPHSEATQSSGTQDNEQRVAESDFDEIQGVWKRKEHWLNGENEAFRFSGETLELCRIVDGELQVGRPFSFSLNESDKTLSSMSKDAHYAIRSSSIYRYRLDGDSLTLHSRYRIVDPGVEDSTVLRFTRVPRKYKKPWPSASFPIFSY